MPWAAWALHVSRAVGAACLKCKAEDTALGSGGVVAPVAWLASREACA